MSNPPWMNGGASAPANPYAQQPMAQPQQLPPANAAANMHWINAIATAVPQGERLPRPRPGFGYVLDVESAELRPSKDPNRVGVTYFAWTYVVVESDDPNAKPGSRFTIQENLSVVGGPGRAQAMLQTALESFSAKQVALTPDDFRSAIAFVITQPCPLAGKSRVYVNATGSGRRNPKSGEEYPQLAWEPMQPGVGSKGLVATQPAQAPQGAGVFAGAPWAQQQQQGAAPAAPPWTPQGTAPAGAPGWPAGIVQTNGQGGQGR